MTRILTTLIAAALATALISMAPRQARAGACNRIGLEAEVLTHPGDEVPAGAGVLIGWGPQSSYDEDADTVEWGEDPSVRPKWRFQVGKRRSKPTLVAIAPGLAVYRPGKLTGKIALVDRKGKKVVSVKVGKKKRAFTAAGPDVTAVELSQYTAPRSGTSTGVIAELGATPPTGAVALVVYDSTSARPMTWAGVKGQAVKQFNVYATPGRCGSLPPDTEAPFTGQKVKLAWVDQFGRVSAMSNEVTVTDVSGAIQGGL